MDFNLTRETNLKSLQNSTSIYPSVPRDFDLSMTVSPHDLTGFSTSRLINNTGYEHTINTTTFLGVELKPSKEVDDLSEIFYEVLQTSTSADILDTIGRFANSCCDSIEKISPWERFSSKNLWLSEEADTWKLMYCLYLDSIQQGLQDAPLKEHEKLSARKLVSVLFRNDTDVRLMQLVVDWLENCGAYQDKLIPSMNTVGGTVHWENTLHHLENGVSLFDNDSKSIFVTELDPDAPRRQNKSIHSLDQEDEKNLCKNMFKEIRCGRFNEASELCISAGQMWRAIILRGHLLLDYPEEPKHNSKFPLVGNQCRELWKWSCMKLVNDTEENSFFKAALGVLCGYLPAVLPVCSSTWNDLLWSHLRVQIEHRVDTFLKEHHSTAFITNTDDNFLEQMERTSDMSIHQIFACVKALYKDKSETNYQELQRHLILDEIGSVLNRAAEWCADGSIHLIRFLAHVVLVLRRIGRCPSVDAGNEIIQKYVEKLIQQIDGNTVYPEQIAFYTYALPVSLQIEKYSEFMWFVEARNDRERVMEAGKLVGIDVEAAAKTTVKHAISILKESVNNAISNDLNATAGGSDDVQVIMKTSGSLEWLSFYPSQVSDAVQLSNAIIRTLIFKGDIDAATNVLSRLIKFSPADVIAENVSAASNALREHLCLKAYLEAINGYASWYRQHVGGRPKSPESLPPNPSFTEKVHYEQLKAKALLQQERWLAAGKHQAQHTKQLLYNVLLFPRGWLVDEIIPDEQQTDTEERDKELMALRKLCIPEIILLLLKVLQSGDTDGHLEAVQLSEIIASDTHQLYKLFPKQKLREVLHKITDSSLYMLDNNRDPWGFVTSE